MRCRTDIWSTQVKVVDGRHTRITGWNFNNLSYLPQLTRAQWGTNPLANTGSFTSAGYRWRTECDTANTGRGGCRSYIWTQVVVPSQGAAGWTYSTRWEWVFNNQVAFRS